MQNLYTCAFVVHEVKFIYLGRRIKLLNAFSDVFSFLKDFLLPSVNPKVEHDMKMCNIVLVMVVYFYILGVITE